MPPRRFDEELQPFPCADDAVLVQPRCRGCHRRSQRCHAARWNVVWGAMHLGNPYDSEAEVAYAAVLAPPPPWPGKPASTPRATMPTAGWGGTLLRRRELHAQPHRAARRHAAERPSAPEGGRPCNRRHRPLTPPMVVP